MRGVDGANPTFLVKFKFVDTYLAMETTVGMRIVVAVIDYIVVITLLEHAVMPRTMYCAVSIRLKDAPLIFVGTERLVACGILHTVGVVMT